MKLLKHLAREFKMDPYKLRQLLRKEFPVERGDGYRKWKWDNEQDPEYIQIRTFLQSREKTDA